jgi:hypothetical protein
MTTTTRRQLLIGSSAWVATHALHAADAPKLKAAIIGHTNAGDYGHGIERIFAGLPNVSVVAVADPDDASRAKAKAASKAGPRRHRTALGHGASCDVDGGSGGWGAPVFGEALHHHSR